MTRNTLFIARREFDSFFLSPIAYVVLFLFLLLTGVLFVLQFNPGNPAEMRFLLSPMTWILIPIAPAISMRLISEELKSGTIETLMTSPVSDIQIILGKWLGAFGFYLVLLAPTLVYVLILEVHANPEYGPIFTGYLGLILLGGLYLAIGLFTSSLTHNQIIAFIGAVFIILLITVVAFFAPAGLPAEYRQPIWYMCANIRFSDFSKGILDFKNVVYFLSATILFLTAAVKSLETRRWR